MLLLLIRILFNAFTSLFFFPTISLWFFRFFFFSMYFSLRFRSFHFTFVSFCFFGIFGFRHIYLLIFLFSFYYFVSFSYDNIQIQKEYLFLHPRLMQKCSFVWFEFFFLSQLFQIDLAQNNQMIANGYPSVTWVPAAAIQQMHTHRHLQRLDDLRLTPIVASKDSVSIHLWYK